MITAPFETDLRLCMEALEAGKTIVYPTCTIWGIGCNALDEAAVAEVFALKNRPENKSLIVLLPDARDILKYIAAPPPDIIALAEGFAQPTTILFEQGLGFPEAVTGENNSVAIRITRDPFCKALLKRFKKPLVSTSANLSGQPFSGAFSDIDARLLAGAGYVVKWRQQEQEVAPPSAIVQIDDAGNVKKLR